MKWIVVQSADGRQAEIGVNASAELCMRDAQGERVLGSTQSFTARIDAKGKWAEVSLNDLGVFRTIETQVVDAWFAHLDLTGERRKKPISAGMIGWGILGSIVLSIVLLFTVGLPWLAGVAARNMPVEWEKELSSSTMASLEQSGFKSSTRSEADQAKYKKLFETLSKSSNYGLPIELHFRSWTDPNAFAIPGGTVVITDQMLDLMTDDDEFLAVMAHEIGHLEKRHGVRSVLQESGTWIAISFIVGDASALGTLATALPATLMSSSYSRDFEREADEVAFVKLKNIGKSPRAFASLMRKMQAKVEGADGDALKYFSSHPPTNERIEAAEEAAN
jgi:Zn-dependent protease with chaperone function